MAQNIDFSVYEKRWAEADNGDCSSLQHGLARTFCDLHCIRDAVKKGDKLILQGLSKSVSALNRNMQALFTHYLGEENRNTGLAQVLMQGEQMVKDGLVEFKAMEQRGMLLPVASAGMQQIARSFGASWHQRKQAMTNGANATHHMKALLNEALALSTVVRASMSARLSPAEQVQQQVILYVANANNVMRAKLQALDLYRQSAVHSKHLQHVLLESASAKTPLKDNQQLIHNDLLGEPSGRKLDQSNKELSVLERLEMKLDNLEMKLDEQKELNEEKDVSRALEEIDSLWWEMRLQFDRYLDASDGQVKSFKAALKALHAYTSECTTNFATIKDAYATSARVERQTHAVLKEVWTTVLPLMGVLTAKIEDNADLLLFAQADVRAVDFSESFGLNTSVGREEFCTKREEQKALVEKMVRATIQKGIYGQALRQLQVTFGHLVMLEDRFLFSKLGKAPNTEALNAAAKRLQVAKESVDKAIPALGELLLKRAVNLCT